MRVKRIRGHRGIQMTNPSCKRTLLSSAVITVMTSSSLFALPALAHVDGMSSAATNAIIGTGKAAYSNAIIGTGKEPSTNAIIGTGKAAYSNAIIGTGKEPSTNAIIGTGKAAYSNAIIGTGKEVEHLVALVGPIETADPELGTFKVHSRRLQLPAGGSTINLIASELDSGNALTAAVFARLGRHGELVNPVVLLSRDHYVAGRSEVVVSGQVTAVDSANGQAKLGAVTFDFTNLLSDHEVEIQVGSVVRVRGTLPQPAQPILATQVFVVSY